MAVLADGRILVAGYAGNVEVCAGKGGKVTYYDNQDFGLARYLPGGTLDTSFGSGGKVATNISTYTTTDQYNKRDDAQTLAVQDDGKIIVGGKVWTGASTMDAVLVRYTPNGTLDTSFGQGGIVRIATPNFNHNGVWDVAIQRGDPTDPADDKIVTMEYAPTRRTPPATSTGRCRCRGYNLDESWTPPSARSVGPPPRCRASSTLGRWPCRPIARSSSRATTTTATVRLAT